MKRTFFLPFPRTRRFYRGTCYPGFVKGKQASRNAEVAYATDLDGEHPTVALWAMTAFAGILEAFRRQPTLSMRNLVRAFAGVPVCLDDECGNALFNINTMEDLRTAESHIAAPPSS